jgi:putative ABC transport system permease protein
MKSSRLFPLIRQNLQRNRKNLVFSSIGIVVGISSFVFFIALGAGIKDVIATKIFPVEANRIQIVPRTLQFGASPGAGSIDDGAIKHIAAIAGVKEIYPRMKFAFLASLTINGNNISPATLALLGRLPGVTPQMIAALQDVRVWLEIMGNGIDPRLVKEDVTAGTFEDPGPGQPIPVLLSRRMIELYNGSFAEARKLPTINEALIPFLPSLPLTLNHSFISREVRGAPQEARMKVVGASRHALMGGITIPIECARRLNRQFAGERAAHTYDALVVEAASANWLGPIQEQIRALGYDVDTSEQRMAESIGLMVVLVTLGFTLISLIIVGIAAVNIAHTFFMIIYERKREIGLLRALGATRRDIRSVILGEATVIGAGAGVLGLGLGFGFCQIVDYVAGKVLPKFPFKPESFFAYSPWMFVGALLFAVLFCYLGAFFPARRAAKLDPVSALSGR